MYIEPSYVTNEVKGSFFRPSDYMAKVPGAHVVSKAYNSAMNMMNQTAAELSLSRQGLSMAAGKKQEEKVFASEDGVVKRYSFSAATNDLTVMDITA